MVKLELPYPPSINHYYITTQRGARVKSRKARAYFREAIVAIQQQKSQSFGDSPVTLRVGYHPPDKRRRDADNINKAVLDVLQEGGVIEDDFQVVKLVVERLEPIKGGKLIVEIERGEALWNKAA